MQKKPVSNNPIIHNNDQDLNDLIKSELPNLEQITVNSNQVFALQDEHSDIAFFLSAGTVQVYVNTSYGPVTLAAIQAPRLIGEISSITHLPRIANLKAQTDCIIYKIHRNHLLEIIRTNTHLFQSIIQQLSEQLSSVNKVIAIYTNALSALEKKELQDNIILDLKNPSPQMLEFSAAFNRFADQISKKKRSDEDMASAALIQKSFLPNLKHINNVRKYLDIDARMRPAREIGGDFYDFLSIDDDHLIIVIGDICGKGASASLFMAVTITAIRLVFKEEKDLKTAVSRINNFLCHDNTSSMFATALVGIYNIKSGSFQYCNCGHNPPVLSPRNDQPVKLSASGRPLGLFDSYDPEIQCLNLSPGDKLFLYTDGVTEAMNISNQEFGEELLLLNLAKYNDSSSSKIIDSILADIDFHANGFEQSDDITCISISRLYLDSI